MKLALRSTLQGTNNDQVTKLKILLGKKKKHTLTIWYKAVQYLKLHNFLKC